MSALFLQGDARTVLRGLPADFIHCGVTSPPYFGLRKYDGGEEIWDGDAECEHEWIDSSIPKSGGVGDYEVGRVGNAKARSGSHEAKVSNICLRCGAWKGQLGSEPTPDLYISHIIQIMREARRVLRPDGVFWLNIGDSWAGGKGRSGGVSPERQGERHASGESLNRSVDQLTAPKTTRVLDDRAALRSSGIKPLDMVLIPSMLALALRADGWYVRSEVVWGKNNPMPESVNGWRWERHKVKVGDKGRGKEAWRVNANDTPQQDHAPDGSFQSSTIWQSCPGCPKCDENDGYILRKGSWRPTDSHEIILMLAKTNHYFCDREAVLEQGVYPAGASRQGGNGHKSLKSGSRTTEGLHNKEWVGNGGRNLRSVWQFPTKPGKFNHYAAYPPKLPELCIKASTSEKGCCPTCGSPWARVVDKKRLSRPELPKDDVRYRPNVYNGAYGEINGKRDAGYTESSTIGWRPTCTCGSDLPPVPCRVLDPFSGAGTTAMVAEQLGLDSIGIDTSDKYIQLSEDRIVDDEQKRIDEQIKQIRKEAKIASKNR